MSLFNRITGARGPSNTNNNQGNREVCKFYLEGRCRFGDQCRYYHPPRDNQQQQISTPNTRSGSLPYHLNADAVRADLKTGEERPEWPLSAFGPGRDAPRQLLEGALEQSPEELRVQYYLARASGDTSAYEASERDGYAQSNQQAQSILNDIEGAIKYVIDGKDVHPNREDMVVKGPATFPWKERPVTGGGSATQSTPGGSTFGRPSTFGRGTPFGQSAAATTQQTSAFGQPSAFGSNSTFGSQQQTAGSAFGQTSNLGAQQTSAFGAPSALGSAGSAFGKPAALCGGASAFGQASTLGGSSPFSGGGQTASNTQISAFGQPSAPNSGSTFGKPSPFGGAAPSGGAFGQASPLGQQSSPFGQQPQQQQQQQQQSTFGQTSTPAQLSTFGQSSAPAQQQSTFGQSSPFGSTNAATASSSPFGQTSTAPSQPAFGSASNLGSNTNAHGSTFGAPSAPAPRSNPFGSGAQPTPPTQNTAAFGSPTPAATRAPGQPPTNWKGQPVTKDEDGLYSYRNPSTGKPERIWFPEGPPGPNADVEAKDVRVYDDGGELTKALIDIYGYVKDHGKFDGVVVGGMTGLIPEIPPRRTWVNWEL